MFSSSMSAQVVARCLRDFVGELCSVSPRLPVFLRQNLSEKHIELRLCKNLPMTLA